MALTATANQRVSPVTTTALSMTAGVLTAGATSACLHELPSSRWLQGVAFLIGGSWLLVRASSPTRHVAPLEPAAALRDKQE